MRLSSELLNILVCPVTGGDLTYNYDTNELISEKAGLAYPIIDSIPILLVDHARKIVTTPLTSTVNATDIKAAS